MPLLEQVLEKYPQDVKLIFKNFPIGNHKSALPAALAAHAAGKQSKFWEYHDLLFKNYNRLNTQKIQQIAEQLNLDMEQFEKDIRSPKALEQIKMDQSEGVRIGVSGTPTVFINGKRLRNRSLAGFQRVIDQELNKQR